MQDRSKLMVMDLDTRKVTELTDGSLMKARTGIEFSWSPDSRWIAFTSVGHGHDPYVDISLVNVDGNHPVVTPVTESAYFDESPRWNPVGNAILFIIDRYGMRNQASWGSQSDVFAVFVNQDALDRFNMNEEDYKLLTAAEAKAKKEKKEAADKDSKDKDSKKDSKAEKSDNAVNVERDGMADRLVRLTPFSSNLAVP